MSVAASPRSAASPSPSTSRRVDDASGSGATKKPVRKATGARGKRPQTPEDVPELPVPGVTNVTFKVDLEAHVRPFEAAPHPATTTAYDQRFSFLFPGQATVPGEEPPQPVVTPPTGVWEASSESTPTIVRWSRPFAVRLDHAALLAWENLSLDVRVEERSLAIVPPQPMYHADGRLMTSAETEAALAEIAAAEQATSRGKRKSVNGSLSSGGGSGASGSASAREKEKAKEKEREKLRKKKEKEKKDRAAKGLPEEVEEPERTSTAHPMLEEEDVPWLPRQTCAVHLSPILFAPFTVDRTIAQSVDPSLCPPGGFLSYTIRVTADIDPMDTIVRDALQPMCLTIARIENLPRDPRPTFEDMRETYKCVTARCAFFADGRKEPEIARPTEPEVPLDARAQAAAKDAAAAAAPSVPAPATANVTASAPVLQTLPSPHADTLRLDAHRVIFLGLYDRASLAAAVQSKRLRVELRDREHRQSRDEAEVAAEARAREAELEAARAAEEAAAAKARKGRKKPGAPDSAARRRRPGTATADEKSEEGADGEAPEEETVTSAEDPSQPPDALAHLTFRPPDVQSILSDAAAAAAAASRLPLSRGATRPLPRVVRYDASQNVYGVAEFSLEDLFRGATSFDLVAPVRPVYPPRHLALIPPQTRVNPYAQTPSHDETTIQLRVRLSRPLGFEGPLPHEIFHRYERAVLACRYDDSILYQKLLAAIAACNTRELGLVLPGASAAEGARWGGDPNANASSASSRDTVADTGVALLSLGAVRLTPAQQSVESSLDIVSCVQVVDDAQRVFLLEGLSRHHGGRSLPSVLDAIGRERENTVHTSSDMYRLLANPTITFTDRLYAGFHAAPKHIRLRPGVTLQSLSKRNAFYVIPRGASAETFAAFSALFGLLQAPRLRVALRSDLFPSAMHLGALEKYFGAFTSDEDLFGRVPNLTETDRYVPRDAQRVKSMPDAASNDAPPEIARPRSRGLARNKEMARSFERDLTAIRRAAKDAERAARLDEEKQAEVFAALSAEIATQQGLRSQYDTNAGPNFAATLARTQLADDSSPRSQSTASSSRTRLTRAYSDAEIAEEAFTGFQRKDVTVKKAAVSSDNAAYLDARRASRERAASASFLRTNIDKVGAASAALAATKSPGDYPRYLQPADLGLREFHVHASQKNNVYDLQKRMMRDQIKARETATGKEHHYTYCAEYLSSSFEKWDLDEEAQRRARADREKWQSPEGFRWPPHKTHAESYHPTRDLHPATVDALQVPHENAATALAATKSLPASPTALKHPHRFRASHICGDEFGAPYNPDWGKPFGVSGDAADELMRAARVADAAEWRRKMVVASPQFQVLWTGSGQVGRTNTDPDDALEYALAQFENGRALTCAGSRVHGGISAPVPSEPSRTDLLSGMLKDPPARPGLRFTKHMRDADGRVLYTKNDAVPNVPVSMHALSPFVEHTRTIHMRTLEDKARAELEDTPREQKPRFTVAAPTPVNHFIHRRKIPAGSLPPSQYADNADAPHAR